MTRTWKWMTAWAAALWDWAWFFARMVVSHPRVRDYASEQREWAIGIEREHQERRRMPISEVFAVLAAAPKVEEDVPDHGRYIHLPKLRTFIQDDAALTQAAAPTGWVALPSGTTISGDNWLIP